MLFFLTWFIFKLIREKYILITFAPNKVKYIFAATVTFPRHKTYTRSLSPWNTVHDPHYVVPVLPFACLFFPIKMNYRITLGSKDKERLLWCYHKALSQWVGERNTVLWIFWSLCLTPIKFLMDHTICNFSQTCESQCMCVSRREGEVKLGFIAHMWRWKEMKEGRQGRCGGCVCASCWGLENRPGCSIHFITRFSSRGPGVCRSSFCGQQSARWLDELHLSKWMLLISTPCYMDYLRTWWV